MRKIRAGLFTTLFLALGVGTASAQAPCQWSYSFVNGVATATYCGNVLSQGTITPGGGNVIGPGSSVSGDIVTFNGTTGKTIQDSGISASSLLAAAVPITSFGAISSDERGTCSTTAASATIVCSNVADFTVGNGIRINKSGAAFNSLAPTGAVATACGGTQSSWPCAPGTTTYTYQIAALDGRGGVGAPIAAFSTSTGPATLSQLQFNQLTWAAPSPAPKGYVIYGRASGSMTVIGISYQTSWFDWGTANANVPNTEDWLPLAPQTVAQNDWLLTTIMAING